MLRFHPDGDLVLTCSWDGTARLWDAGTGRSVVHWGIKPRRRSPLRPGRASLRCGQGRAGRPVYSGSSRGESIGRSSPDSGPDSEYYRADISPDDLLAVGMEDGVRLWSWTVGENWPSCRSASACRQASSPGSGAASCSGAAPAGSIAGRFSMRRGRAGLRIGTPRKVRLPMEPTTAAVGPDGRMAVVACEGSAAVLLLDLEDEAVRYTFPHASASSGQVSPDGRWVATTGWHATSVKLWDAGTGALVDELATGPQNSAFFSPDGRTMITSLVGRYQFREVPSWRRPGGQWEISSYPGWVAFSPNGRFVALEISPAVVHSSTPHPAGRWPGCRTRMPTGHDGWASRPRGELVVIAGYSKAIHLWDLRRIGRDLVAIGLRDELIESLPADGPCRTLEIRAEAVASLAGAAEECAATDRPVS